MLDAYVSAAGVRRLLIPWGGALGALGSLLYRPELTGLTISLSPSGEGARIRVHSALDPHSARNAAGELHPLAAAGDRVGLGVDARPHRA